MTEHEGVLSGGSFWTQGAATIEGKPFVLTQYEDNDGNVIAKGQISPETAIAQGIRCISAAIEAERDAGMIAFLRHEMEMPQVQVAALIDGMRKHRQQYDPHDPKEEGDDGSSRRTLDTER